MDFKKFDKIIKLDKCFMAITQKLHGTNASVIINKSGTVQAASRNRLITPEDDNYGFANWVKDNEESLKEYLGEGQHYGEWVGKGINSTEGFEDTRRFVLFDFWKYDKQTLPKDVLLVPVLYFGELDLAKVEETMEDLKENGSKLVEGFMAVEGVVVSINGHRFKKTFKAEETKWTGIKKEKKEVDLKAMSELEYLCQPLRLANVITKEERLVVGYPKTLPETVKLYSQDLLDEEQISQEEFKIHKKNISRLLFQFIKQYMEEKYGYEA